MSSHPALGATEAVKQVHGRTIQAVDKVRVADAKNDTINHQRITRPDLLSSRFAISCGNGYGGVDLDK